MAGRHRARPAETITAPRIREDDEMAGAMIRMAWAWAQRIGADPGALAFEELMSRHWEDAVNAGYALANRTYSVREIARVRGVTPHAAHERIVRGRVVLARIEAKAIADGKVTPMITAAELRETRARAHIEGKVEDVAAGPRQQQVYRHLRAVGE